MSFFNDAQIKAFETGEYICSQCGKVMVFEDENEDVLVCESCGHSVDLDHYGAESDEEYNALYPPMEEVLALFDEDEDEDEDDDDCGEKYDEVYGELSD